MDRPPVDWFPDLAFGLPVPGGARLEGLVTAAWKLAVDGRALVEDMEGASGQEALIGILKLKFAELLVEVDLDLSGRAGLDEDHLLACALERGLGEVARLDGPALAAQLGLGRREPEPLARVAALWGELLDAFPGQVPDPLAPTGQGPALRALRAWTKLCRALGVDDGFLVPLVKAV